METYAQQVFATSEVEVAKFKQEAKSWFKLNSTLSFEFAIQTLHTDIDIIADVHVELNLLGLILSN